MKCVTDAPYQTGKLCVSRQLYLRNITPGSAACLRGTLSRWPSWSMQRPSRFADRIHLIGRSTSQRSELSILTHRAGPERQSPPSEFEYDNPLALRDFVAALPGLPRLSSVMWRLLCVGPVCRTTSLSPSDAPCRVKSRKLEIFVTTTLRVHVCLPSTIPQSTE